MISVFGKLLCNAREAKVSRIDYNVRRGREHFARLNEGLAEQRVQRSLREASEERLHEERLCGEIPSIAILIHEAIEDTLGQLRKLSGR